MVVALAVAIIVKLIAMAVRGNKTAPPKSTKS